tara:strand:- start:2822 stop:3388 length:567 start_codon:yes stop_codon:yes gene_type:complete
MNFRLFDIVETEKFQFVRIHKNGNGSVVKCIQNNFKKEDILYVHHLSKKPRFCIIRDPYERFLSGLKWDLWLNKVNIEDVDIKTLFTANEHHPRNSWVGHIKHSVSQIPYLFNVQCSHYVDMSDINLFLKMHFGNSEHENKSKNKIKIDIEKYVDKNEIMKYLHLDYYVYNNLKRSPFLWEWQHGKIF